MSERNIALLLQDILDAINYIKDFTKDTTFAIYQSELKTRHAVERNFTIIGEAAARIDKSFKDRHAEVDWRQVKDFRNIIVHDYFGIDDSIVWEIIHLHLPQLEKEIMVVLASV